MTVYFTSDTHFGHNAIIRLCDRPYADVDAMDAGLIAAWNQRIGARDTVYHLGDFCFRSTRGPEHYRERLNGEIHLLIGNHDKGTVPAHADLFASVSHIKEIKLEGQKIVLCHYPMREWPGAFSNAWHLFGHVHGGYVDAPWGHSMDVGVDAVGYRPLSFKDIAEVMAERTNPFIGERRETRPTLWQKMGSGGNV